MPLKVPMLDNRNYQQILGEALARIPIHNPEWTNFNDSDPGITILQLFSFMSENLLYRSNLIPERNRRKFLTLLGLPMQAAEAAKGMITFSNDRGPLASIPLSADKEVLAGKVPFRTVNGMDLLPLEGRIYFKGQIPDDRKAEIRARYDLLYASFVDADSELDFYETRPLPPLIAGAPAPALDLAVDTVDGSVWIALLARTVNDVETTRQEIGGKVLTLGVLPALDAEERLVAPLGTEAGDAWPNLLYEVPVGGTLPDDPNLRLAAYQRLDARPSVNVLAEPGVVQLALPDAKDLILWDNLDPLEEGARDFPPSLEDSAVQNRVVTWIRISLSGEVKGRGVNARLSWLGLNASGVLQRARVPAETLGQGTSEPDQIFRVSNRPVIPGSLRVFVNGEQWAESADLEAAPAEVQVTDPRLPPGTLARSAFPESAKVYQLDAEAGEIRFGNGLHGMRPPRGAVLIAGYDYGGGRQGMVGIGAINGGSDLPPGVKVISPVPTWGGDDAETTDQAERRISRFLRHRDRLVSEFDFKEITWRTPGVDLGRVEILPLFNPNLPLPSNELTAMQSPGVVTVMVIPRYDLLQPEAPKPDRLFLQTVTDYLCPRRIITTELHLRGPEYISLYLSVGLDAVSGTDIAPVREQVKNLLRQFLSPLFGGFERTGWPLSKAVEDLELWAVATRVSGVAKVNGVILSGADGVAIRKLPLLGLQLPRLLKIAVQSGDPEPLSILIGGTSTPDAAKRVPVPVIPEGC